MEPLSLGLVIGTKELADELKAALTELPVRVLLERNEIRDWAEFLDKLDRTRPDAVLLEITHFGDHLEEAVRRIRHSPTAPAVLALHTLPEPQAILRAMRSGATEFLYPPLADNLPGALERISQHTSQKRQSAGAGKVVGLFSAKGGCGATTIACHLAVEIQQLVNNMVLLADFDLEAGMVGFLMKSSSGYTVLDAVQNIHRLDLSFWKALVSNGLPQVEVIPAPPGFLAREQATPERLRHVLRFVRSHYGWTLVDLGRSLTPFTVSLLDEIDDAFLVTTLDVPALHKARQIIQALLSGGFARDRLHLILNRLPKRPEVTAGELEAMLGLPVFATLPSDYPALYDSYAEGSLLPNNSTLRKQFLRLAEKITGVEAKKATGRFSLFGLA